MSRINTNVPAIRAINRLGINHADLSVRLERLATGLRINHGADDPAGLITSELLRSEMQTIQQAIANSTRAHHVIATAEGAMNELSALLLELQSLVVEAANEAGLTEAEVAANQLSVDSILDSIDRIASTTTFAGQKLLDGTRAYILSGVVPTELASVSIFGALVPNAGSRRVSVRVTQSAQTAQVAFVGTNAGGTSVTSATTIEIRGTLGSQLVSFTDNTTLAQVRTAINDITEMTGVSAVVSSPAIGAAASALLLNSIGYGSDAFVSVEPITGDFIEAGNASTTTRGTGVDVAALVNGLLASGQGLRADVRSRQLDLRLYLDPTFAQTTSTSSFVIAGGGAVFQLAPQVSPNGQVFVGLAPLHSTKLGNSVVGLLYTLRSGLANDLTSQNFATAQAIIDEAIEQVASQRGRLGSIQRNHIETNISSQQVALENITASESVIRDADMATEVSALTRAEVLVQSNQTTLQIANSIP
ncbi:MAG: flagellin, partial [Planctomycetes bacterium]|nr:flagellin [Planctomycetota bacterium]